MTANATNTFTTSLIVPKALQRSAPRVDIRYSGDYVVRPFNLATPIRSFDFLERSFRLRFDFSAPWSSRWARYREKGENGWGMWVAGR